MNKKVLFLLSAIFLGALGFGLLRFNSIKDNKIYTVEEKQPSKDNAALNSGIKFETKGKFYDASEYRNKIGKDDIFVAASKDKKHIFYMTPENSKGKIKVNVIKGRTNVEMNLIDWNLTDNSRTTISSDTFITSVNWNPSGDHAAFAGTAKMFTYGLNKSLSHGEITDRTMDTLFWSPDNKTIYAFDAYYPVDGITFSADGTSTSIIGENSYGKSNVSFMGKINDNTYFAAVSDTNSDSSPLSSYRTVIADAKGNILSDLCPGFYKDSYGKSILIRNMDRTLSFIKDFNLLKTPYKLTRESVYDSGFVFDGGFYFITEDTTDTNNGFILHRMDRSRKEIWSWKISGSSLLLSSEGTKGYVNGEKLEVVDFQAGTVTPTRNVPTDTDMIESALNLAVKNIKVNLLGGGSLSSIHLGSGAYANISKYLSKNLKGIPASYKLLLLALNPEERVVMTDLDIADDTHATATVNLSVQSYKMPEFSDVYKINLIKEDSQWKISDIRN